MSLLQQFIVAFLLVTVFGACKSKKYGSEERYILVKEQGSFAVGGTVVTAAGKFDPIADGVFNPGNQSSAGQTLHGDHAFVVYQKPVHAHRLPLIFWNCNLK